MAVSLIVFVDKGTTSIFAFPTKCNRLQQIAKDFSQAPLFQLNKILTQVRGAALVGARKVVCRCGKTSGHGSRVPCIENRGGQQ